MKITRITKKNEKDVIIWLDNLQKLYISYELLLKNGLRINSEISESHFDFLIKENQKYYLKQKAYSLLSRRIHSRKELQNKLLAKEYQPEMVNDILEGLAANKLIDDYRFAVLFTEEKINNSSWGKTKLKYELIKRGISREIISRILEEKLSDDNQQLESAVKLAERKAATLKNRTKDDKSLSLKIFRFLQSRGYSYDISKKAVEAVSKIPAEEDL